MSRFALGTRISYLCKEAGALKVAKRLKHPLIGYRVLRTDFASLDACELFALYARPRMNGTSLTRANIITLGRLLPLLYPRLALRPANQWQESQRLLHGGT